MPKLKLKTRLHRQDIKGAWTYLVVREASNVFGSKVAIQVKGTIDNYPIEGTLQPKGDGSHWFAVKKEWRDAIGKTIGETVDVIFELADKNNLPPEESKKIKSAGKRLPKLSRLIKKNKTNKK